MAISIRKIEYYYVREGSPHGEGYDLLSNLKAHGVNLLAFSTFPAGTGILQLILFPERPLKLISAAQSIGLVLSDPSQAFLIQGDDEVGVLVELHRKLHDAGVDISASSAVVAGNGRFGYVVYVRPQHFERAAAALGVE